MKNTMVLIGVLSWLGCHCALAIQAPKTVTIATGTLPPHSSQLSPYKGYVNHIISSAFDAVGIEARFVFMPWARAYKETEKGEFLATSYWYRDPKHQKMFYLTNNLIEDRVVFFRRKSPLVIQHIDDIKELRLRLGLTRGYTYTDEIWQWAEQNPKLVSVVNTDEQNLQMLILGRIDIFPADEITGWYDLNKNFSSEQVKTIETLGQGLISRESALLLSRARPAAQITTQEFNRGLAIIEEQGLLAEFQLKFVSGFYSENDFPDDKQTDSGK